MVRARQASASGRGHEGQGGPVLGPGDDAGRVAVLAQGVERIGDRLGRREPRVGRQGQCRPQLIPVQVGHGSPHHGRSGAVGDAGLHRLSFPRRIPGVSRADRDGLRVLIIAETGRRPGPTAPAILSRCTVTGGRPTVARRARRPQGRRLPASPFPGPGRVRRPRPEPAGGASGPSSPSSSTSGPMGWSPRWDSRRHRKQAAGPNDGPAAPGGPPGPGAGGSASSSASAPPSSPSAPCPAMPGRSGYGPTR